MTQALPRERDIVDMDDLDADLIARLARENTRGYLVECAREASDNADAIEECVKRSLDTGDIDAARQYRIDANDERRRQDHLEAAANRLHR